MSRRLIGALLVVSLPFVAGCGANRDSGTDEIQTRPYTASVDAGDLAVRAIRVLPAVERSINSNGDVSAQGYLTLAIVNRGTQSDTLTSASIEGGTVTPGGAAGSFRIDPQDTLSFGSPDLGETGPTLEINGLTEPLTDGLTIPVTLTFASGGTVRTVAPIYSAEYVGSTDVSAPIETTGSYPSAPPAESGE